MSRRPIGQVYSDEVVWPSSGIVIPDMLRDQFGDLRTLARHYENARQWLDHMSGFMTNGIISRDNYGDWCVPPENLTIIHSTDTNRITDKALLATAYFYHDYMLMEQYAKMLGKADDARAFHEQAENIKSAFNERFLDRDRGQYSNGTQTSCVLPLAFGLVPDDLRQRIFSHLVDKIENESHGHVGTGLVGPDRYLLYTGAHGERTPRFGLHHRLAEKLSGLGLYD